MENIKVGYILKRYPRFSETFVVNEILAHEAAGHEIEIFALREVIEHHFQDILGRVRAPVTRVPDRFPNADVIWSLFDQARARLPGAWDVLGRIDAVDGRDVAQAIIIALACRERGITHLHAHFGTVSTSVARVAAALAGIRYSFTAHAKDIYFDYAEPQHLDVKIRDAAGIVTVSDYNVAYLREHFETPKNLRRIYNGIDLTTFAHETPDPEACDILAVGRLVEKKGFHILIEAMRLLNAQGHDLTCRIIGHGDEHENLSDQISASGLGNVVQLVGPMPQGEVLRQMRSAAVLACPCVVGSDGNRDGLPTVLLEAMALGLPCIATDVTGIPELVRDGETGLLVPEGDPEALADAITRIIAEPGLRRHLSRRARSAIERDFDVARNAAALRDVFRESAGTPRAALRGVA